mgnify:CR=1 FL=1
MYTIAYTVFALCFLVLFNTCTPVPTSVMLQWSMGTWPRKRSCSTLISTAISATPANSTTATVCTRLHSARRL